MPVTTIFVGSSASARPQAKALIRKLASPTVTFLPWWESFTAGGTLLEELDEIKETVDAAVLLMSPESDTKIRGNDVSIPNLNVLFELGYLSGHLGRRRVAMVRYGDFYLPSDLAGYVHITGSSVFRRGGVVRVGKRTVADFGRWVEQV